MSNNITFRIVGRYMSGNEVSGYHLISDMQEPGYYSREQVILLAARGQITNCKSQITSDGVTLVGVGTNLLQLPVMKIGKNEKNENLRFNIHKIVMNSGSVYGFIIKNSRGQEKLFTKDEVIKLAKDRKLDNVRCNMNYGKPTLEGIGVNIRELPIVQLKDVS